MEISAHFCIADDMMYNIKYCFSIVLTKVFCYILCPVLFAAYHNHTSDSSEIILS